MYTLVFTLHFTVIATLHYDYVHKFCAKNAAVNTIQFSMQLLFKILKFTDM